MKVLYGLNDHAVIQRFGHESCLCQIIGETPTKEPFTVAVYSTHPIATATLDSVTFERLLDGNYQFKVLLTGIPVGGPYTIELSQYKKVQFTDILVGDLYVLGGQSNMEGIGRLEDKIPGHPLTRAFYMDDCWKVALDPIHDLTTAKDEVHRHINGGDFEPRSQTTGTGLGVSFGQTLGHAMGVPIGLISCAHGGTSMDQWSPHYALNAGYGLYHMMIKRIQKAGGHINGLLWYQGCSDTYPTASITYLDKMSEWISAIRSAVHAPLPIVLVQIARTCSHDIDASCWNAIQQHQYNLGESVSNIQVVSALDLQMDDFIHISGKSQQRLGKRCADAMLSMLTDSKIPTPRLKSVSLERASDSWNQNIRLTFDFIDGELTSNGNPAGFMLTDVYSGDVKNYIYQIELLGNEVLLKTTESLLDLSNCYLNYGHGFMPYCNITDTSDRALPALHYIKLGESRSLSAPCTCALIQFKKEFPEPSVENELFLEKLTYKDFWYYFLNSHPFKSDMLMYHMPFELFCENDVMTSCDLLIGGCGDFEVYLDGKLSYAVTLIKPIAPDQQTITLNLAKGKHLLSVWYRSSDLPKGIFARFETKSIHSKIVWITPEPTLL